MCFFINTSKKLHKLESQTPFQPQPCAPIERSELNMYCTHRKGGFPAPIFVFSVQFCIQTCRQKGRGMRTPAPIEHERPLGWPKKNENWTFAIPSVSIDGFRNFTQYASDDTYAYTAVSPQLSRAARTTTEFSARNGRTG